MFKCRSKRNEAANVNAILWCNIDNAVMNVIGCRGNSCRVTALLMSLFKAYNGLDVVGCETALELPYSNGRITRH